MLHDLVNQGLPFEFLERIASLLQAHRGVISKAICMSPTTVARRAKVGRFSSLESDRIVALVAVVKEALSLFEYDVAAATEWMNSPVRGLGSKRPNDMLGTRVETNAVVDLIGRLKRGSACVRLARWSSGLGSCSYFRYRSFGRKSVQIILLTHESSFACSKAG
ncbi:antitoxin [Pseudomonas fluorescens]|uniref:Antitoxin n=1 Tax=Pseudomonas fluorescens TaxID=294 RepID=A0A327N430_PSEFL|nr:antitoxin Xre/MbcA/ParS toxin-binding domain-containing protein [Pseudomonas fluorescens]RAI69513.1 antitoxin [Pseudomonas fluorescens]